MEEILRFFVMCGGAVLFVIAAVGIGGTLLVMLVVGALLLAQALNPFVRHPMGDRGAVGATGAVLLFTALSIASFIALHLFYH